MKFDLNHIILLFSLIFVYLLFFNTIKENFACNTFLCKIACALFNDSTNKKSDGVKCSNDSECTNNHCDLTASIPKCYSKYASGVVCDMNRSCISNSCVNYDSREMVDVYKSR